MNEKELNLLFKNMGEIIDNQILIMQRVGAVHNDPVWGDGCEDMRELADQLRGAGGRHESEYCC